MTTRSIYAWLVRRHPGAFRERFEQDMLWVFDETVRARGGIALIIDAAVSLARQWMLRPRNWRKFAKPAPQSGSVGVPPQRTGRYRGLTPEVHFLILWMPFAGALPLLSNKPHFAVPEDWMAWMGYAGLVLLLCAWYRLYKGRLLRAPLTAPISLAHLPYRLQLEDSLKTIQWMGGAPGKGIFAVVRGVAILSFIGLWDIIATKLGHPRFTLSPELFCYAMSWSGLAFRLNGYAVQTLQQEIERLPENS